MIIGLTGPNAAGKGEVAECLRRLGFTVYSLSDIVREEAERRGLAPERGNLIETGNLLRRQHGPGVLALRILPRLNDRDVVDSIRNPAEVEVLRGRPGFVLLGVRASRETRFGRSVRRGRRGDPATVEEFASREAQENAVDPDGQQLERTFDLADRVIDNDADLPSLRHLVSEALRDLPGGEGPRGRML